MTSRAHLLLLSGSLRAGSTNTAVVRTATLLAPPGTSTVVYERLAALPAFNPDDDTQPLHRTVADLRAAVRSADAILVSTPEYAGALPGSFKNLLKWTIGDDQPGSIYEKPIAWVNALALPTGAANAHAELRTVLGYAHATIVDEACAAIPVPRAKIGEDGLIADPHIRSRIADVLATLTTAATG